jgi:hypothetical protein
LEPEWYHQALAKWLTGPCMKEFGSKPPWSAHTGLHLELGCLCLAFLSAHHTQASLSWLHLQTCTDDCIAFQSASRLTRYPRWVLEGFPYIYVINDASRTNTLQVVRHWTIFPSPLFGYSHNRKSLSRRLWTILEFGGFFCWHGWVLTQGLELMRQTLSYLTHTFSPFCFGYFGDKISLFAQAGLNLNLSIFSLPLSRRWQAWATTHPGFSVDTDTNIFWGKCGGQSSLESKFPWSLPGNQAAPLYLAIGWDGSPSLGWPQTAMLLISASQVAKNRGVSHQCLA